MSDSHIWMHLIVLWAGVAVWVYGFWRTRPWHPMIGFAVLFAGMAQWAWLLFEV